MRDCGIPRTGYPRFSYPERGVSREEGESNGCCGLRAVSRSGPETYDEVVASLDLDANSPAGAICTSSEVDRGGPGLRDLENGADVPGVPRAPVHACPADARCLEPADGRDRPPPQPVGGRDRDHRTHGRRVASRALLRCVARSAAPRLSGVSGPELSSTMSTLYFSIRPGFVFDAATLNVTRNSTVSSGSVGDSRFAAQS